MRLFSRGLFLLGLLTGISLTLPAMAGDPDPSLDLFNQGLEAMRAKRFDEGCPKLEQSYQLKRRPGTLFTLAECEAQRARIATAVRRYEEYLKLFESMPPEEQIAQEEKKRPTTSREARDKLKPLVPQLTLTLPPEAPKGTVVRRDGVELGAAEIGVAMPVDPGECTVTVRAPGGPEKETKITIGQGEKKSIQLELVLPAVAHPPPSPPSTLPPPAPLPPTPPDKSKALIGVGAGLTLVTAGIGIVLLVASSNDTKDADGLLTKLASQHGPYACSTGMFPQDCAKLHQLRAESDHTHNAAIGLFAGAGVAGGATLAYTLWALTKEARPQQQALRVAPIVGAGTTGAVVSGRF